MATARRFHMEGARVGLVARNAGRLASVAADLDGSCCAVAADLAVPGECARAVDEIEDALGPVDVLVSNAGVLRRDFVGEVKVEDFEESYRVNVGAALWLTQRVLPGMRERGYGRVVLVASELGLFGGPSYASYCMSKFALVGLAEVLWHELAGSGVRACAVCPGDVRTDQLDQEHRWGPTGGVPPEKAMSPDYLATAIVRSLDSRNPVVIVDKPHLRAVFNLWGGPRRLRLAAVHSAYTKLLKA
ncbi:MAG: SDR family oxidoreductase [Solirubrobacterales bacterium]|nr:SDR family oxidoreductase [Solirubrobacterales bacterium]